MASSQPSGAHIRAEVSRAIPGFPTNAGDGFDLTRHGILDHAQRSLLREWVQARWDLRRDELDVATTLGRLVAILSERTPRDEVRDNTPSLLRPLEPPDYAAVYRAAASPVDGYRWRFRGRTPSPEEFEATLFRGCLAQFAVNDSRGLLAGIVSAYQHDADAGHCTIAFLRVGSDHSDPGVMITGMRQFLGYLFRTFRLRKAFAELPEFNMHLIAEVAQSLFVVEGYQRDCFWYDDRLWDKVLVSVSAEDFVEFDQRFVA